MGWSYTLDGLAVALNAQRPGDATRFSAVSTDTRTLKEGDVYFALRGERFDGNDFVQDAFEKGAAAAVSDTQHFGGVSFVVPDALEALQQFAAFHRKQYPISLLGITGSCGKTTSKDFIAALLASKYRTLKTEGNLNNEIGAPLTLLRLDDTIEKAVIEMGANHTGEIKTICGMAKPTEGAITLIAPSHLEGFGSIEDIAKAKAELPESLDDAGVFYVNTNDAHCRAIAERLTCETVRYGDEGDVRLVSVDFDETDEMIIQIEPGGVIRLPLRARAHAINVALAVAVGLRHGIEEFEGPLRDACGNAARFKTLDIGGITVIDDSYNANPTSMAASLEALAEWPAKGKRIAALGDMLELGAESEHYHQELGRRAARLGIDTIYARGPLGRAVAEAARAEGLRDAHHENDHAAIAAAIAEGATPGDVLLLKGSRGMRMETVLTHLRERLGLSPETANGAH